MPWDVTDERLATEMQAYTMAEIGKNLAQTEAETPKPKPRSQPLHGYIHEDASHSKFEPKKPAQRYAGRHPEEKALHDTAMEVDEPYHEGEDLDDDSDYIIDTYVRIPAHAVESEQQKNFGLLVLESQPDIDEFYREEEDSDEEADDEDEDENAENHYKADYPDEEVASDDEYDGNAYKYRTGNASDLEEYDENDDELRAAFSGDEGESTRYPWAQKPWMKRPTEKVDGEDMDE